MKKLYTTILVIAGLLALSGIAYATTDAAAPVAAAGVKPPLGPFALGLTYLAIAIGMAIAAAGCGIAQGIGLKAACEGTARNPEAGGRLMVTLVVGLAFIESLAIYALVINLILLLMDPLSR